MYKKMTNMVFPVWLKWVCGIIGLLLIAAVALSIYLYQTIEGSRTAHFDDAAEQVLNETSLETVDNIQRYHGEEAYYTVYGKTKKDKMIVFYPFNKNQADIVTVKRPNAVSEETIRKHWKKNCSSCTLIDIAPGVLTENNKDEPQPIWEATYKDSDQYVMAYFSIFDGQEIKLQRFNRLIGGRVIEWNWQIGLKH